MRARLAQRRASAAALALILDDLAGLRLTLAGREALLSAVDSAYLGGVDDPDDLPDCIKLLIPVFVPRSDPDRDAQIVAAYLAGRGIRGAARLTGRDRGTVRAVIGLKRLEWERQARKLLGSIYADPGSDVFSSTR